MAKLDWKHTGQFFRAALWMDLSCNMFVVTLPYVAMSVGASSLQLGLLGSARSLVYMASCPLVALLWGRANRRARVAVSALAIAAVMLSAIAARQPWHLYLAVGVWSLALSFFWPTLFSWLGDSHPPEQLGRATGLVNLGWSVGAISGGVIAGWLFQVRPALPLVVAVVPTLLAGMAFRRGTRAERPGPALAPSGASEHGSTRRLVAGWLGSASACCLIGLMAFVFPRLGTEIGVTAAVFGILMAVLGAGRILMFVVALGRDWLLRDWRFAAVLQLVAAGMVATVSVAQSHWWLGIAFGCVGCAVGAAYYLALYRSLEGAASRGLKSGLHEASLVAGALVGSLGGGVLAETWGLRAPYAPLAGVVGLLVIVQAVLNVSTRQNTKAAA